METLNFQRSSRRKFDNGARVPDSTGMAATPRIIVHDATHATAALAAAEDLAVPVVLASAAGAGVYMGAPWFLAVIGAAARAHPRARFTAQLDCGAAAGYALAALQAGVGHVRVALAPATLARLADIAAQLGAQVESPDAGEGLDLLNHHNPERACRDLLMPLRPEPPRR